MFKLILSLSVAAVAVASGSSAGPVAAAPSGSERSVETVSDGGTALCVPELVVSPTSTGASSTGLCPAGQSVYNSLYDQCTEIYHSCLQYSDELDDDCDSEFGACLVFAWYAAALWCND